MFRRILSFLSLGFLFLLICCGDLQAGLKAQCLQKHCGLKLTAVQHTPVIETDLMLFAANAPGADAERVEGTLASDEPFEDEFDDLFADDQIKPMPDPIRVVNRPLFTFNDKVYFWVLKPVARGYGWIVPEPARKSVKNFFYNLRAPIRMVNCLLQRKGCGALNELYRFGINTTIGLAGLFDPATSCYNIRSYNEDFGLTLGHRMGPGFYLTLPLMGPSSARDGVGLFVDSLVVPTWYVLTNYSGYYWAARAFETVNNTSLSIGEYEDLIESAIDPYVAVRDAYHQHREDRIRR